MTKSAVTFDATRTSRGIFELVRILLNFVNESFIQIRRTCHVPFENVTNFADRNIFLKLIRSFVYDTF